VLELNAEPKYKAGRPFRVLADLVKKNTTISVTIAIPKAFSLSLQKPADCWSVYAKSYHTAQSTQARLSGAVAAYRNGTDHMCA